MEMDNVNIVIKKSSYGNLIIISKEENKLYSLYLSFGDRYPRKDQTYRLTISVYQENGLTDRDYISKKDITIGRWDRLFNELFKVKATITKDLNNTYKEEQCVICLSEEPQNIYFACGHMCMCAECYKGLDADAKMCPMCRCKVPLITEKYELAKRGETRLGKQLFNCMIKKIKLNEDDWEYDW